MDTNEETNRFIDILDSMGIRSYDHNLPSALDEYARRFTLELLTDAMDYAKHAGRKELEPDDIKLAIALSSKSKIGVNSDDLLLESLKDDVNKKDLTSFLQKDQLINRFPEDNLLIRNFTFVPGAEGYGEELVELGIIKSPEEDVRKKRKKSKDNSLDMDVVTSTNTSNNRNQADSSNSGKIQMSLPKSAPTTAISRSVGIAPGFGGNDA